MTSQEINNAIATKLGWTHIENFHTMSMAGSWKGYPRVFVIGSKVSIPNYNDDLNAMRKAELIFNNSKDSIKYGRELCSLVLGYSTSGESHNLNYWETCRVSWATASQRAEAFLRTINKWKD